MHALRTKGRGDFGKSLQFPKSLFDIIKSIRLPGLLPSRIPSGSIKPRDFLKPGIVVQCIISACSPCFLPPPLPAPQHRPSQRTKGHK